MNTKNITRLLLFALLFLIPGIMASCGDDNDNGGGAPEIDYVRITDPEKADSTFTQASTGKMIAIMGRNLDGATHLYINGQSVNFNPNMNTDRSLIAVIPTENDGFELTVWNPELPSEIRIVTPRGEATYAFKVLAPEPKISRVAGEYPRKTGDVVTVYGINFLDIERVYFSDVNPYPKKEKDENGNEIEVEVPKGNEVDATEYSLSLDRYLDNVTKTYVTDSEMKLTLPEIPYTSGFLVMETPQGNTVIDFSKLPPVPVMSAISSDMPVPGSKVTIKGLYFINVEGIMFGDKIAVAGSDVEIADDESSLTFIMPEKPAETTTISVLTQSGESNRFYFYNYETVVINFDDLGIDEGHSPNSKWSEPATSSAEPYISDGRFTIMDARNPGMSWWGTMVFWRQNMDYSAFRMPSYDIIPAETPSTDVYLMFECYTRSEFTKVMHTWVHDTDDVAHEWVNWNWDTGTHYETELMGAFGEQVVGEWYTVFIPMSKFEVFKGKTYADIHDASLNRVRLMLNNYTDKMEKTFICVDNVRFGLKQTYTPEL